MTDDEHPVTIRDNARFKRLVRAWKFGGHWEGLNSVYEGKQDVPSRLHGFTIIASNDPAEPYGALMQMAPSQANDDTLSLAGGKLLAKIRLE